MPRPLGLPGEIKKTTARVCESCALYIKPPVMCRRLRGTDGKPLQTPYADRCRELIKDIGQSSAFCDGWRYEYMVSKEKKTKVNK